MVRIRSDGLARGLASSAVSLLWAALPASALAERSRADEPWHRLQMPVQGVSLSRIRDTFDDDRSGRPHRALDVFARRGTPVRAADDGVIVQLTTRGLGGTAIEQHDPTGSYCYYYAHLEGYADGLREGRPVWRGQVIGFVGSSGNAPRHAPHLHFAVRDIRGRKHCWAGRPVNPLRLLAAQPYPQAVRGPGDVAAHFPSPRESLSSTSRRERGGSALGPHPVVVAEHGGCGGWDDLDDGTRARRKAHYNDDDDGDSDGDGGDARRRRWSRRRSECSCHE